MNRSMMIVWAFLVAVVLSGLIHTADADVGSVGGLFSPVILVSVLMIGLVIMVPILVCQFAVVRYRWGGLVLTVVVGSFVLGFVMALLGSTAETTGGWLVSLVGSAALFGLVLLVGAGPAIYWALRSGRRVEGVAG